MTQGYKTGKEAFVSGMTGSSITHINLVSLVALVRPSNASADYISLFRTGLCLPLCRNPNATSTNSTPRVSLILATPCTSSSSKHDSIRKSTYNVNGSTFNNFRISTLYAQARKRDLFSFPPTSSFVGLNV